MCTNVHTYRPIQSSSDDISSFQSQEVNLETDSLFYSRDIWGPVCPNELSCYDSYVPGTVVGPSNSGSAGGRAAGSSGWWPQEPLKDFSGLCVWVEGNFPAQMQERASSCNARLVSKSSSGTALGLHPDQIPRLGCVGYPPQASVSSSVKWQ